MKRLYFTAFLVLSFGFLFAQTSDLLNFNQQRLQKTKTAMTILGTWAVGNIAVGAAFQANREGEVKYFHQMNALWNTFNLGIAGFGYYSAATSDPGGFDLYQTIQEQHKFQKILLFNAGLDIGYMAAGAYLTERAKNTSDADKALKYKGWGKSIILQGGFLFAFDLITFFALSSDNEQLRPWLEGLSFSGDRVGLNLRF